MECEIGNHISKTSVRSKNKSIYGAIHLSILPTLKCNVGAWASRAYEIKMRIKITSLIVKNEKVKNVGFGLELSSYKIFIKI